MSSTRSRLDRHYRYHRFVGLDYVDRLTEMTANKRRSPRKPTLLSVAKQARKAGIEVARYEIEPSGKIVVVTGKGDWASVEANNPWDAVLSGDGRRRGP